MTLLALACAGALVSAYGGHVAVPRTAIVAAAVVAAALAAGFAVEAESARPR